MGKHRKSEPPLNTPPNPCPPPPGSPKNSKSQIHLWSQLTGPEEDGDGAGEAGRRLMGKPGPQLRGRLAPQEMNKIRKIKQTQTL